MRSQRQAILKRIQNDEVKRLEAKVVELQSQLDQARTDLRSANMQINVLAGVSDFPEDDGRDYEAESMVCDEYAHFMGFSNNSELHRYESGKA
jgi:outer membrane protein TolC